MDYESILETFENLRIELEYAIADFQRLRIDLENAIQGLERKKPSDDSLVNFADFVKAKPAGASSEAVSAASDWVCGSIAPTQGSDTSAAKT
jgi:hypothetical protein